MKRTPVSILSLLNMNSLCIHKHDLNMIEEDKSFLDSVFGKNKYYVRKVNEYIELTPDLQCNQFATYITSDGIDGIVVICENARVDKEILNYL